MKKTVSPTSKGDVTHSPGGASARHDHKRMIIDIAIHVRLTGTDSMPEAVSCLSASNGAILVARQAGTSTEITVTESPRVIAVITFVTLGGLGVKTKKPSPIIAFIKVMVARPSRGPAINPNPTPNTPTTTASAITRRMIWRRVIPTNRREPNCRILCVIDIAKAL